VAGRDISLRAADQQPTWGERKNYAYSTPTEGQYPLRLLVEWGRRKEEEGRWRPCINTVMERGEKGKRYREAHGFFREGPLVVLFFRGRKRGKEKEKEGAGGGGVRIFPSLVAGQHQKKKGEVGSVIAVTVIPTWLGQSPEEEKGKEENGKLDAANSIFYRLDLTNLWEKKGKREKKRMGPHPMFPFTESQGGRKPGDPVTAIGSEMNLFAQYQVRKGSDNPCEQPPYLLP